MDQISGLKNWKLIVSVDMSVTERFMVPLKGKKDSKSCLSLNCGEKFEF